MTKSEILSELKFSKTDFIQKDLSLEYRSNLGTINFVELQGADDTEVEDNFYNAHRELWNENKSEILVAINGIEIFICDSKTKPTPLNPIDNAKIKSFDYTDNTPDAQYYLDLLKKESIDNGYFWEKINNFLKERKRQPIDVDLLENLIETKKKISKYLSGDDRDKIAQKLIDRCLFIRFIEDRIGENTLKVLLNNGKVNDLLDLFGHYNVCLNGDLFEADDISSGINDHILVELDNIFGEYYTYPTRQRTRQRTLIPYQFNKIPILLISHIYERFLNPKKRRGKGIVFTPENVADYILDNVFKSKIVKKKIEKGGIRILDPSCGSGIFLVKFFERLIKEKERKINGILSIEKRAELLKKTIFGIDTDDKALRIAALSLYLKIFENVNPKIIEEEVFKKYEEKKEHFMFPGLKDQNLILGDSLFADIFPNDTFDVIIGNPPWGYRFTENEKRIIERKWPYVSYYQSSQCFLFKIADWMENDCIVGMVVNLSNFTNLKSVKFRKKLLEMYSLNTFLNLVNIKKITFWEPACVLIFDSFNNPNENTVKFIIPDMTQFSKLTEIIVIREDNRIKVPQNILLNDEYWHLCILGFYKYQKLIERIEKEKYLFNIESEYSSYLQNKGEIDKILKDALNLPKKTKISKIEEKQWVIEIDGLRRYRVKFTGEQINVYENLLLGNHSERFREGARLYETKEDANSGKQIYESSRKEGEDYYPKITKIGKIRPYLCCNPEGYIKYGSHLYRKGDLETFKGNKLVITRSWPIRSFSISDSVIFAESFDIFKLAKDEPDYLLQLFEAILNSKLAYFYLAVKYLQRPEGNFTKINKTQLQNFPISKLENEDIIREIINLVRKIKDEHDMYKYQDQIDELIFDLYGLNYYERQQIKDYYKIQQRKGNYLVSIRDMKDYIKEFIDSFSPFIDEAYFLSAESYICNFLGSLVKFKFLNEKRKNTLESSNLKGLLGIIQSSRIEDIEIRNILEERKERIYDVNRLYIYKSNHFKDWTRTEALNDVKRELAIIYEKLPNMGD